MPGDDRSTLKEKEEKKKKEKKEEEEEKVPKSACESSTGSSD